MASGLFVCVASEIELFQIDSSEVTAFDLVPICPGSGSPPNSARWFTPPDIPGLFELETHPSPALRATLLFVIN